MHYGFEEWPRVGMGRYVSDSCRILLDTERRRDVASIRRVVWNCRRRSTRCSGGIAKRQSVMRICLTWTSLRTLHEVDGSDDDGHCKN